ncbi:tryptamine 5-hydroxylase-like [Camellia sinensis]|uniref:tryptamine 5-hydroxylase-like n=1 Tax=Camellia sinensis TaxID=4442 RepID=UPI0010358C07|nr:tryptamine 5-hydroxylase-like [Camellia sinensis]
MELLRLYLPLPLLIPHEASKECTVGNYDVPRGTMLMVNPLAIHRDPKLWENLTKFMPEWFEADSVGDGYRMIPFGSGRRGCPGASLANKMVGKLHRSEWGKNICVREMVMLWVFTVASRVGKKRACSTSSASSVQWESRRDDSSSVVGFHLIPPSAVEDSKAINTLDKRPTDGEVTEVDAQRC